MTPTVPEILQSWLGSRPHTAFLLYTGGVAAVLAACLVLWFVLGRGPRRRRRFARAQRCLQRGDWQKALDRVHALQKLGRPPAAWQGRFQNLEGECHRAGGDAALREKNYETSIAHYESAAALLNVDRNDLRSRVIETMLAEVRGLIAAESREPRAESVELRAESQELRAMIGGSRLSALRSPLSTLRLAALRPVHQLVERILQIESPCPEASFWQGLGYIRDGRIDLAVMAWTAAHEGGNKRFLDPPLYLGALLVREGRPQEALRYLAEANRIESNCPLVTWQLGMALAAVGTDPAMTARTLQRALGTRGLGMWEKMPESRTAWPADMGPSFNSATNLVNAEMKNAPLPAGPQRFWMEVLPEGRSFIRRLALRYFYHCPVLGSDPAAMVRQGQETLAQVQYRLGNFQASADLYEALLRDRPPSAPLLRGLGFALARLDRFDDAYKHLRAAHEQEEPNPITTGFLALCAALGKPTRAEDKPQNVAWAIRQLAQFEQRGDAEWADLINKIFAEARSIGLAVASEDQLRLCDVLASVNATDTTAAAAFDHLAATYPDLLRSEHAWLYGRAAQMIGFTGQRDLTLLGRALREREAAAAFYAKRGWNFDDVEYTYLQRCSAKSPGNFPEEQGPDYPLHAQDFLLVRSRRQQEASQREAALTTADVLLKLAPRHVPGIDWLAHLHYHLGNLDRAAALLAEWHTIDPADCLPLVRRAVIEQLRDNNGAASEAIDQALILVEGKERAKIAFLGARLALRQEPWNRKSVECESLSDKPLSTASGERGWGEGAWISQEIPSPPTPLPGVPGRGEPYRTVSESADADAAMLARARACKLLQDCLRNDPDHVDALWCLAALHSNSGDCQEFAALAPRMNRPDVEDPRFHYLAAVCNLASGEHARALEACRRVPDSRNPGDFGNLRLDIESEYLAGRAHLGMHDTAAAIDALQRVAETQDTLSAKHASALLGQIHFAGGAYHEAIRWWNVLNSQNRAEWQLAGPLRQTLFLSGLLALKAGKFAAASARFQEAGQSGPLLNLAMVKAAQQCLFVQEMSRPDGEADGRPSIRPDSAQLATAAQFLEQTLAAGSQDADVAYLLALACKRQGKPAEARNALCRVIDPDANAFLQMGLLSLQERGRGGPALQQAEQDFARAWQMDPKCYAACCNLLLTRLSLGQLDAAANLIPQAIAIAGTPEEERFLTSLQILLRSDHASERRDESRELRAGQGGLALDSPLSALRMLTAADENRLLQVLRGLPQFDLATLAAARPNSQALQEAQAEATIATGKRLIDRCEWGEAERLLTPLAGDSHVACPTQAALLNLLGCASCLNQDFEGGLRYFTGAAKLAGDDARICQNLGLVHEWLQQLVLADPHWNRYFDLLDARVPAPPDQLDYHERLSYEGLTRLASSYAAAEKWTTAISYLQRALRLRPRDADLLDRLFHLHVHARQTDDAQRALQQLRQLRPADPLLELYQLDTEELHDLKDVERSLAEIVRIVQQHPDEARVAERAAVLGSNLVHWMGNLCNHLNEQLANVRNQIRHLPSSQVNWSAVDQVVRDLLREYQKLRRAARQRLALGASVDQQRTVYELVEQIDRKIEVCRSMRA